MLCRLRVRGLNELEAGYGSLLFFSVIRSINLAIHSVIMYELLDPCKTGFRLVEFMSFLTLTPNQIPCTDREVYSIYLGV